jgi:hypothetical protein
VSDYSDDDEQDPRSSQTGAQGDGPKRTAGGGGMGGGAGVGSAGAAAQWSAARDVSGSKDDADVFGEGANEYGEQEGGGGGGGSGGGGGLDEYEDIAWGGSAAAAPSRMSVEYGEAVAIDNGDGPAGEDVEVGGAGGPPPPPPPSLSAGLLFYLYCSLSYRSSSSIAFILIKVIFCKFTEFRAYLCIGMFFVFRRNCRIKPAK